MVRIGVTGTNTYENKRKIKDFIFKLSNVDEEVVVVGIGDKNGADRHVRRYALEMGMTYKEANLPHTTPTLYSMMNEGFYNKPYNVRNFFVRNKVYAKYIDRLVVFDDSSMTENKVVHIINEVARAKKKIVMIK
jgi:hypothetical protein